jgi:hypothetical protein
MIGRLSVVPDNNRVDRQRAAHDAWAAFEGSVPNHPFAGVRVEHDQTWEERLDSLAMAVPLLNANRSEVESGRIVLGERFFANGASVDDRMLTLLHECIHLKLCETMSARTIRLEALRDEESHKDRDSLRTDSPDIVEFKRKRSVAAFQFLLFPDEVWAEVFLRDHYPEWFDRRLEALVRMREGNYATRQSAFDRIPVPLHAIWMLFELIRVDLANALERDDQRLARLNTLRRDWSSDLFSRCSTSRVESALQTFGDGLPRPIDAHELESRFVRYFEAVLTTPAM